MTREAKVSEIIESDWERIILQLSRLSPGSELPPSTLCVSLFPKITVQYFLLSSHLELPEQKIVTPTDFMLDCWSAERHRKVQFF